VNDTLTTTSNHILLDTNILQFLQKARGNLATLIINYLVELTKDKFVLAISNFSIFELLDGCPTKEKEEKLIQTLETLVRFEVSTQVLATSARLSTLYRKEKAEYDNIEDGDKIIGSTSILTDSFILTANMRDFPRPFFIEEKIKHTIYKEGHNEKVISIYLLKPDIEAISYRFERRP